MSHVYEVRPRKDKRGVSPNTLSGCSFSGEMTGPFPTTLSSPSHPFGRSRSSSPQLAKKQVKIKTLKPTIMSVAERVGLFISN
jgi:hypothetical protein